MGTPTTKLLSADAARYKAQLGIVSNAFGAALKEVAKDPEAGSLPAVTEEVKVKRCGVTLDETAPEGDATIMCVLDNNNDPKDGYVKASFTAHYKDGQFVPAATTKMIDFQPVNIPTAMVPNRAVLAWLNKGRQGKAEGTVIAQDLQLANSIGIELPKAAPVVVDRETKVEIAGANIVMTPVSNRIRKGQGKNTTLFLLTSDKDVKIEVKLDNGSAQTVQVKAGVLYEHVLPAIKIDGDALTEGAHNVKAKVSGTDSEYNFSFAVLPPAAKLSGLSVTQNRDGSATITVTTDKETGVEISVGSISKTEHLDKTGSFSITLTAAEVKALGKGTHTVSIGATGGDSETAGDIVIKGGTPPPAKPRRTAPRT